MRMKAVCEATGLTDRAVRYYISEGLIDPDYTENYTGRRTYDFSESDIRQLQDITVLRKFEFTVAEIRSMLQDPAQIEPTVAALRKRKRLEIAEEQALLDALERLTDPCANVAELALALCAPAQTALVPAEDSRIPIEDLVWDFIVRIFRTLIAWGPLGITAFAFVYVMDAYEYPVFLPKALPYLLILLIPSLFILNWSRLRERFGWRKEIGCLIWTLCLFSIPVCGLFASVCFGMPHSMTTDIHNYRILDSRCGLNRWSFAGQVLPSSANTFEIVRDNFVNVRIDLETHYYYHFREGWESAYDLYAEWPLQQEEFDAEVARVTALYAQKEQSPDTLMQCARVTKGPWKCLFYYWGEDPFQATEWKYRYCIFAYDPERLLVRYAVCASYEHGEDQPYYLELDWE